PPRQHVTIWLPVTFRLPQVFVLRVAGGLLERVTAQGGEVHFAAVRPARSTTRHLSPPQVAAPAARAQPELRYRKPHADPHGAAGAEANGFQPAVTATACARRPGGGSLCCP